MNSKYYQRQLLLKAIKSYKKILKELTSWKDILTGGLITDVLLARDTVQSYLDDIYAVKDLDSEDLEYLDLRLSEINQLDSMLKAEVPRIIATYSMADLRGRLQCSGWWWYLEELSGD